MTDEITEPMHSVPRALLDSAVLFLNRAVHTSGVQLAATVSAYVTETFFAGDLGALSSKDPQKTASFRALCEREDLSMSAVTLHRLVRIGHQARHLPADLAERLSLSQHRALLPVANVQHKQHLARLAVEHGWTVEQLTATIAAEQPRPPNRTGRPRKPEVLKWLHGLQKASAGRTDPQAFGGEFAALEERDQARVYAELLALQENLGMLIAGLPR